MSAESAPVAQKPERIAVVVCHGMGQQVAFDSLGTVASAVSAQLGIPLDEIRTRLVSNGERYLARAEIDVAVAGGDATSVHFYESYWAPLVEGKVTLYDTLRFLVEAGLAGVRFAFVSGEFDRWMFHTQQRFEIPARRVYQFAIAVWVILLLATTYVAIGGAFVAAAAHFFGLAPATAPHAADFLALCWTLVFTAVASATIGAAIAMGWLGVLRLARRSTRVHVAVNPLTRVRSPMVFRIVSLAFALLLVLHEIGVAINERWPEARHWMHEGEPHARSIVSMALLGGALYGIAQFLVGYVGDVAAYVSPFKVSRFQEIRSAIQAVGRFVTQHVYTALDERGAPLYDAVFFVGHSLGSVVAYDSLDDALARDARVGGWGAGSPVGAFDVVGRTRMLLTFGSPLDKTAFVFRTQGKARPSVREKVAAQVQPLIFDRGNRVGLRWVNLWSTFDWISGSLEFYDEGERISPTRRALDTDVRNVHTRANPLPWMAHTGYWSRPVMPAVIARAILGRAPAGCDAHTVEALEQAFT